MATTTLVPPPGGSIHILPNVNTHLNLRWGRAIRAVDPELRRRENLARHYKKIGRIHQYFHPEGYGTAEEDLILLNLPEGGSFKEAKVWGKQNNDWIPSLMLNPVRS